MAEIIRLPDNIISKRDKHALESFGAYSIAHGHTTRWQWTRDNNGDEVFQLFRGAVIAELAVNITRDSELDTFCASDSAGELITTGTLRHVFTELEYYLSLLHEDTPPPLV